MAMENDAKFEEELNFRFKTDMKNLMDFENQSKIPRICTLTGSFWQKYIMLEYRGVMFDDIRNLAYFDRLK